ncbi:MAG: 2-amino-4-hydroxy-6-hydroxymethyldihydropteridine diphosphokinase [Clostridia bacterium]|nr:2-amino-4-hydroxy-6-hydroxymethyldihydropteridine diphosphokinase [Clostridia bacterium]
MKALLGLGGNIGDMPAHIDAALDALGRLPLTRVVRESTRIVTAPVGYTDQPDFLNSVVEIETALSPRALLGACLGIEATIGRVRTFQNAPRVIDIDVLLIEGFESDAPELIVPHPRMFEREFVLAPLRELFPDGTVYGYTI